MRRKYVHDLRELKEFSQLLIRESLKENIEGDSDYLDSSIIKYVKKINENPDLVTTGSCSGHDGNPFISIVFKDDVARDHYVSLMRKAGFDTQYSGKYRMGYFSHNFDSPIYEEIGFGKKYVMSSESGAERAWKTFARIFGKRMACKS